MSDVRKPVILDETGQISNQRITDIGANVDADCVTTSQDRILIGEKIESEGETLAQSLNFLGEKIDGSTTAVTEKINALPSLIPPIISAMDRLDIIYYVENE